MGDKTFDMLLDTLEIQSSNIRITGADEVKWVEYLHVQAWLIISIFELEDLSTSNELHVVFEPNSWEYAHIKDREIGLKLKVA